MPLYNNILSSKKGDQNKTGEQNASAAGSSSTSMKLLQDHLMSKKRSKQLIHPPKPNKQSQNLSENSLNKDEDEYDPMVPNSYEVLKAEHRRAEEQKFLNRKAIGKLNPKMFDVLDKLGDDGYLDDSPTNRGIAIAPPSSLQSTTTSVGSRRGSEGSPVINKPQQIADKMDASSAAAKIMSKMGYKAGQGLGKDEQGISSPLEVEKSGLNSGRIVLRPQATIPKKETGGQIPTRVLLLQNMVGPGEVDEDLEAETKEECTKYGQVVRCIIHEIPNKQVPDDEAVRIFVEFSKADSAVRASNDLNGRYFGGRVVKASFYSEDKFTKRDLGPW